MLGVYTEEKKLKCTVHTLLEVNLHLTDKICWYVHSLNRMFSASMHCTTFSISQFDSLQVKKTPFFTIIRAQLSTLCFNQA